MTVSRKKRNIVGLEVGKQGTSHLQIYFQLANQAKITTIKNWGGPWSRIHFESARGTDEEAADYCKKEGNFFEAIANTWDAKVLAMTKRQ